MKIVAASLAIGLCALAHAQPARSIRPSPAAGINIDGRLDEPAWASAQDSGAFVWLSDRAPAGLKVPTRTSFKLLAAPEAIYFGVTCAEPSMATLQDAPVERDGLVFKRDCIEFFLAPEGAADNCYQFALSAGNAQWDMYFIEGGQTTIGDYSALWESAIHKDKDFWSAEVRIPLAAFVHTPPGRFSDTWLLNVARERQLPGGGREYLTWAPLRTALRDIPNFIRVPDMPRKSPKDDIGVTSITVRVQGRAADGYVGEAVVATRASAEAAGRYLVSLSAGDKVLVPPQPALIRAGESTTRFRDVRFVQLGKTELKATLASAGQRPVAGSYATVRLDYAPLLVTLDTPFYRNAFYPGQDATRVAGAAQVNLAAQTLAGARLNVSLLRDKAALKTASFEIKDPRVSFELANLDLPEGAFVLRCAIVNGGKELASLDTTVSRLAQPAQGACVWVDKDLNLVVNGKPRFQRGWFGGPGG
ncbi:MAG TPA: hypothetical protein P5137_03590, partial [Candidatus Brocadiia bacterium]|nr:hypothetical protein [Candidatus Brocadiia bacterium]